jgi:hypothetical protein
MVTIKMMIRISVSPNSKFQGLTIYQKWELCEEKNKLCKLKPNLDFNLAKPKCHCLISQIAFLLTDFLQE